MTSRSTRSRSSLPVQRLQSQSRARWTLSLTKILVDLMVDQVHKGNKQKKNFSKKAWECICSDFHNKTCFNWDQEQLKSRYIALKKQYVAVKSLLDQSDFRWDEPTGVIMATDEAWDKYIEEHPDCETMKSMGYPIYKQLCTIFSTPGTGGRDNGSNEHEQEQGAHPSISYLQHLDVSHDESSTSESEDVTDTAEHSNLQSITSKIVSCKRGRKGVDDVIAKAILEMAAASKLRALAIRKLNERYSITECVRALDELQGIEEQIYFAALDLFNNRTARETFLSLKVDKRLTWLNTKCLGNITVRDENV